MLISHRSTLFLTLPLLLWISACGSDVPSGAGGPGNKSGGSGAAVQPPRTSKDEGGATNGATVAANDAAPRSEIDSSAASPGETVRAPQPAGNKPVVTRGGSPPANSDTLMLYYANDPDTVNVLIANDNVSTAFQRWVYESLADQNFENPDKFDPSLAESWEFDKQNLVYTIKLRKGVKWHPIRLPGGKLLPTREFTAKDVKFTFDCILNPNIQAASIRSYYEDVDAADASQKYKIKVTVVDDYTVKVKWTKPYFQSDEFTLGVPIMPRHVYSVDAQGEPISFDFSSREFAEGFNNHWANRLMCGTGPMIFREWSKDERVVLERNPDYYDEPFFFSRVVFRSIPNPNTAREKVLQNELDWGLVPEKNQYLESLAHDNVKSGKVKPIEFDYPSYRYIGYNVKRELFKDKRVRQALSHAVPVQNIIDVVFKGLARRTTGPLLFGSSGYDATIPEIPYDLNHAAKLLSEAGWEDTDGSGVRSKTVNDVKIPAKFDLMIFSDSPSFLTIAEIMKESCRKIGVDVQISPAKWALMLQKLRQKEFDAAMLGWALSWKQDLFQTWHSSQADVPDSSNAGSYTNHELDTLIEELRRTLDLERQIELYHQMHRIIYDDQPYTFLFMEKSTGFRDGRLDNIHFYRIRPGYDAREWLATVPRESAN